MCGGEIGLRPLMASLCLLQTRNLPPEVALQQQLEAQLKLEKEKEEQVGSGWRVAGRRRVAAAGGGGWRRVAGSDANHSVNRRRLNSQTLQATPIILTTPAASGTLRRSRLHFLENYLRRFDERRYDTSDHDLLVSPSILIVYVVYVWIWRDLQCQS